MSTPERSWGEKRAILTVLEGRPVSYRDTEETASGKRRATTSKARWGASNWKTRSLVLLGICLYAGASVGICDVAGFARMEQRMAMVQWPWLLVDFAGVAVGLFAYTVAWFGIIDTANGPQLSKLVRFVTATVGFGGFLIRGGSTVDRHV